MAKKIVSRSLVSYLYLATFLVIATTLLLRQPTLLVATATMATIACLTFAVNEQLIRSHLTCIVLIMLNVLLFARSILGENSVQIFLRNQSLWAAIILTLLAFERFRSTVIRFDDRIAKYLGNAALATFVFWIVLSISKDLSASFAAFYNDATDKYISFWNGPGGIPRFNWIIFSVLPLIPIRRFSELIRLIILTAPGAALGNYSALVVQIANLDSRSAKFAFVAVLAAVAYILWVSGVLEFYFAQKTISLSLREERFPNLCWLTGCDSGEYLNESYFIAIAQECGILFSTVYAVSLFTVLYIYSKSVSFILISAILLSANPVPLGLVIMMSNLWTRRNDN
jgi:hypothetical protein